MRHDIKWRLAEFVGHDLDALKTAVLIQGDGTLVEGSHRQAQGRAVEVKEAPLTSIGFGTKMKARKWLN